MKTISLWCHQGLGDHVILNGAVNKLSQGADVLLPCFECNLPSVRSFYVNNPNVHIYTVNPGTTPGVPSTDQFKSADEIIKTGFYGTNFGPSLGGLLGISFAENFYKQLGLPYQYRWSHNSIEEASKSFEQFDAWSTFGFFTAKELDYTKVFVHDDYDKGLNITKLDKGLTVFRLSNNTSRTILRYIQSIKEADERHFIDSGPYHVCDSLLLNFNSKNHLHKYSKYSMGAWTNYPTLNKWEIIN